MANGDMSHHHDHAATGSIANHLKTHNKMPRYRNHIFNLCKLPSIVCNQS